MHVHDSIYPLVFFNQIHRFLYTSISNKTQNWHPIFLIYLLFLTLASDTTSRSSKISFTFKIPHAFAKTNLKPIAKISRRFVYLTRTLSVTLYCAWYKHLCYILICSTSLILKFKKIYFLVLSGILKMNTTLEHNLRTRILPANPFYHMNIHHYHNTKYFQSKSLRSKERKYIFYG